MDKKETVFSQVEELYKNSDRIMGQWMWSNHVQWVADKAAVLAEKYEADIDKVYCAALLHDLGDSKLERGEDNFDSWSEEKGKEILEKAGFNDAERDEVIEVIIRPHSCRPGNLPTTLEGKVLATADAMFHLQTSFFPMLCYMNRPEYTETYEQWQEWFNEKIERDAGPKIFFEDERLEVKPDYDALCRIFKNNSLNST